jgi:arylsulfatase A-like enzyme
MRMCRKLSIIVMCSLFFPVFSVAQDNSKPNIIVMLTDDLGYGDLSCYNPLSKIRTPRIDNLALEGMKFTDAHSPSAVCTPTRYGLLTGRYAWRGELKRGVIEGDHVPLLEQDRSTIASLLKQQGYATAIYGKWHLGLTFQDIKGKPAPFNENGEQSNIDFSREVLDGPLQHGFDESMVSPGCPSDDLFNFWVYNGRIPSDLEKRDGVVYQAGWEHKTVDTMLTHRAVSFIRSHLRDKPNDPFFLYLPFSIPHIPWDPPEFIRGASDAGPRGDQVALADWCVGQIDALLQELGIVENTMIIFTSDNGPREGENGHDSSGSWRGQKGEIWEGGHRIPLIIRWPGKIEPGIVCASLTGLHDFYATFADLLGEELPLSVAEDSYSMLHLLLGYDAEGKERQHMIHHSGDGVFSMRMGDWKYIAHSEGGGYQNGGPVPDSPGQLYHLQNDPGETTNLYAAKPDVVAELDSLLNVFILQGNTREYRE